MVDGNLNVHSDIDSFINFGSNHHSEQKAFKHYVCWGEQEAEHKAINNMAKASCVSEAIKMRKCCNSRLGNVVAYLGFKVTAESAENSDTLRLYLANEEELSHRF